MDPLITSRQTSAETPRGSLIPRPNSKTYENAAFDNRHVRLEQHMHFEIAPSTSAQVGYHTLQEPSNGAPNGTPLYAKVNRISSLSNGYPSHDEAQPTEGAANRMPYARVNNRASKVYGEYSHLPTYDGLQRFDIRDAGMMPLEPPGYVSLQNENRNVKFMEGCDDIYY